MYEKSLMQLEEEYDCGSVFFFFDAKRTRTSNMLKCMSYSIYLSHARKVQCFALEF